MKAYLTTLIEEKGKDVTDDIGLEGHFGLTWEMLIDFIEQATEYHKPIKDMLVKIDFANGDVFDYLNHLAEGMVKSLGY